MLIFFIIILIFLFNREEHPSLQNHLILDAETEKIDVYQSLQMIKDRENRLSIEDVSLGDAADSFVPSHKVRQESGFFYTSNWLKFDVENRTEQQEWMLEFAFPIIYELEIFQETNGELTELYHTGAYFPFDNRPTNHRHFIFELAIEPNTTKTFYVKAVGGGDLHPPINIWKPTSFLEKNQQELLLLGLFYGIVLVMIIYNLFLYFSLKMRSYLYYVCVIFLTLMGKLSINGIGYQFFWPDQPEFNIISTTFWVSTACIMIVVFTRSFLDLDRYIPFVKQSAYILIFYQIVVIATLYISHYTALSLMVFGAFITFVSVLASAFISLRRGARQARFFIAGWLIFLTGVFITILERTVVLPFTMITEYAGQATLTIEVVLLSFALADKINIMRKEKALAEQQISESQHLAMVNLKKSDRLKDEFLAVTSHELRTPLFGMMGIAESIRDGVYGKVAPELRNQLSMIISSGQRLTKLVNDILDLSVLHHDQIKLDRKKIQLQGIIDNVVHMSQALVKHQSIRLTKNLDATLPHIYGDPSRIQQILYNLIDNAVKYTKEGTVNITAEAQNEKVIIEVIDTGVGIAEEQLEHIFQPFHQATSGVSRKVSGLGIGLDITKRLVELHDGTIDVQSEVNKGTRFRIMLPALLSDSEQVEEQQPIVHQADESFHLEVPEKLRSTKQGTVLIVDDEVVNVQIMINYLSMEGYHVIHTTNGAEVLSLLQKNPVDIVILDLMMPSISGYEICKRLRKSYSLIELPIIMLTAKNQDESKIASFDTGANDYIVKPCDKSELLARVKTLVNVKKLNQELSLLNQELERKVEERTNKLHEVNHDLTKMNQRLVQMAESRRDMLQNIAHELGTPVTLMHSYIQSIKEGLISIEDTQYNQLVMNKINVLRRLIKDLYDLALLESGKINLHFEKKIAHQWLENISKQLALTVEQGGRGFECQLDASIDKTSFILVDEDRIQQVFLNLISNAIKHTNDKFGKIYFYADWDSEEEALKLLIRDNGVGIEEEMMEHIFERFYKGKNQGNHDFQESIGLGLAIVYEVLKAHQGSIKVSSILKQGTQFIISLPLYKET